MAFKMLESKKTSFYFSRAVTREYSKSFYFATLLLPRKRQWATFGLYGFCRYADNLIDKSRGRTPAETLREVDALENEIKIAYRTGDSEHPALGAFIFLAKQYDIPIEYPLDLLKGVAMDLKKSRIQNFSDLYLYAYRVAGVVGIMMTFILGYKSDSAFYYAEKLGIALQLTNILRDILEDKNMNRIYLPKDEMQRYGVKEQDILNERMTPDVKNLIKFQVDRAHSYYEQAREGIRLLQPESRFSIYSAAEIYRGILYKIEKNDYNPFLGRVFVSQYGKMGIILREYVRAKMKIFPEKRIDRKTKYDKSTSVSPRSRII